ncbi:hypothetical protein BDP27DRAFT_1429648 [Rhodocollybia butyracea]|uniref:Uncharacterized protein n=1 Tax=Rhodocollybia butyracea TaxID=206335 RepID=A0A9P5P8B5_9AGAR|nr:hypothetical protein BDP27DRAFT_1429648 [Rhodocollybia butyracea]
MEFGPLFNLNPRTRVSEYVTIVQWTTDTWLPSLGSLHVHHYLFALLLWDLAFFVPLASHAFPFPSSLANSQKFSLSLMEMLSQSNVLLVLSPSASTKSSSQNSQPISGSSSIWAVSISIPQTSSLTNILGKAFIAKPWLAVSPLDDPLYADATEGDKQ